MRITPSSRKMTHSQYHHNWLPTDVWRRPNKTVAFWGDWSYVATEADPQRNACGFNLHSAARLPSRSSCPAAPHSSQVVEVAGRGDGHRAKSSISSKSPPDLATSSLWSASSGLETWNLGCRQATRSQQRKDPGAVEGLHPGSRTWFGTFHIRLQAGFPDLRSFDRCAWWAEFGCSEFSAGTVCKSIGQKAIPLLGAGWDIGSCRFSWWNFSTAFDHAVHLSEWAFCKSWAQQAGTRCADQIRSVGAFCQRPTGRDVYACHASHWAHASNSRPLCLYWSAPCSVTAQFPLIPNWTMLNLQSQGWTTRFITWKYLCICIIYCLEVCNANQG